MNNYQQVLLTTYQNGLADCYFSLVRAELPDLINKAETFLHENEYHYFKTLKHQKRQLSFLLGRYNAKKLIANCKQLIDLSSFEIINGIFQQPVVRGTGTEDINISISHCQNLSAVILYPTIFVMGIDIEIPQPNYLETLKSHTSKLELDLITQNVPTISLLHAVTLLWTMREALTKALKTGLTLPLELTTLKTIQYMNNYWIGEYLNFTQYKVLSFQLSNYICSMVVPKQLSFILQVEPILQWLEEFNVETC